MRWIQVGLVVFSGMVMIGCPSEFGKEGRIAKAIHEDVQENLIIKRCSDDYKKKVCDGPQRDEQKCLQCG